MEEINFKLKVHLFVCVNDRAGTGDPKPSCGPKMSEEDVKEIKLWIREKGLTGQVVCSKTKCLGFCNPQGGVACIYPSGRFFKGIKNTDELKELILDELENT